MGDAGLARRSLHLPARMATHGLAVAGLTALRQSHARQHAAAGNVIPKRSAPRFLCRTCRRYPRHHLRQRFSRSVGCSFATLRVLVLQSTLLYGAKGVQLAEGALPRPGAAALVDFVPIRCEEKAPYKPVLPRPHRCHLRCRGPMFVADLSPRGLADISCKTLRRTLNRVGFIPGAHVWPTRWPMLTHVSPIRRSTGTSRAFREQHLGRSPRRA